MDTELLQALGAEMAEQMAAIAVEIRRDCAAQFAEQLAAVQRAAATEAAELRAARAEADHRLELVQRDLDAARAPVVGFACDAAGALTLLQRNGPGIPVPLPDVHAIARALVEALGASLRETLGNEQQAQIARTFELFCNAPTWSETTVYREGEIVQIDIGRTYRVRKGIKATMGRAPGDHAEHWERLGTAGFRVLKSRPETLEAGDFFAEHDSRFLHDGRTTALFVQKALKTSDVERAGKVARDLAQLTQAEVREHAAQLAAVLQDVQRSTAAANDAGELSVQALAALERIEGEVAALQRRVDALAGAGGA